MHRTGPMPSFTLGTMPGARTASCTDATSVHSPAIRDDRHRALEAMRQRERERGVGRCAHLNRHGCGLGARRSQHGLCFPCSYFCTHSEHDPHTANTDTAHMTHEESALIELALTRSVMFCEPEPPAQGPGLAEAAAVVVAVAQAAERQAEAYARLVDDYRTRMLASHDGRTSDDNDTDMQQQAVDTRQLAIREKQQRAQQKQEEDALYAHLTDAERAELRRKRRDEEEEQSRLQLLRLQQAGIAQVERQQAKLRQERQQWQRDKEAREAQEAQKGRRQRPGLPARQPLPVATRGE